MPRMDAVSLHSISACMPAGLRHPAFGPAWEALKVRAGQYSAVMALPGSIDHAVVLASLGLPAALLSSSTMSPIAPAESDVDLLIERFGDRDDIVVGFEPASTPFFYLVSESVRSLRRCVETDPRFSPVRHILTPQAVPIPARPTGTWGVYPKALSDRIATIVHADNRGSEPTTVFIGGWMEGGMARDTGFLTLQPMPLRILELIMRRGSLAISFMNVVGKNPGPAKAP